AKIKVKETEKPMYKLSFVTEDHVHFFLQFRNDLPHLKPSGAEDPSDLTQPLDHSPGNFPLCVFKPGTQQWNFVENELKDATQTVYRLRPHYAGLPTKSWQYDKVKEDYAQLSRKLTVVTRERDLAVKEKHQLKAKLENLEQVLKHMREAAERRQQLELEHEQALAVLNAKQQEIDLLQKAQVEAKKEHEGAVQLLEWVLRREMTTMSHSVGGMPRVTTSCPWLLTSCQSPWEQVDSRDWHPEGKATVSGSIRNSEVLSVDGVYLHI
ncbi:PREDICTED: uncharacterized protein LOC103604350, partial [Galeopterus variegatus]|uniref:Uncharacterized protein LOC103604350 n=1 Tax=Galeopterus variegatus TaxID=482537 RepID=A0ABM0S2P0_GALVR